MDTIFPDNAVNGTTHFVPLGNPGTIARPRLVDRFPTADTADRLVVVHGPAGSGKTTVLSQWVRSFPFSWPVVWISLEQGDSNRMPFWSTVITTIQAAGVAPPQSHLAQLETTALMQASILSTLIRAFSTLESPLWVVLDDYHHVADERVDADIVSLLEVVPWLRLVTASRTRSALDSGDTRARLGAVTVFDARSFAFTLHETRELLATAAIGREIRAEADIIHRRTRGWPLATRALLSENDVHSESGEHSTFITEYTRSVLDQATEPERTVLLATALTSEFSADLAAELTRLDRATILTVLDHLGTLGITTKTSGARGILYEHHPALREAFIILATDLSTEQERRNRDAVYAHWLERDRPEKAFALYCSIGDYEGAENVFAHNFTLLSTAHAQSTAKALHLLDTHRAAEYPTLLGGRILVEFPDSSVPQDWLSEWTKLVVAASQRRIEERRPARVGETSVLTGVVRLMGAGNDALVLAERLSLVLSDPGHVEHRDVPMTRPLMHAIAALTYMLAGRFPAADQHFAQTSEIAREFGIVHEQVRGANGRALTAAVSGDIRAARNFVAASEKIDVMADWENHVSGSNLRLARAYIATESRDAAALVSESNALTEEHWMNPETWPLLAITTARNVLWLQGPEAALDALDRAIRRQTFRPQIVPVLQQEVDAFRIELLLLEGKIAGAISVLERASTRTDSDSPSLVLSSARIALAKSQNLQAADIAAKMIRSFENDDRHDHRLRIGALLVHAISTARLSQTTQSAHSSVQAVTDLKTYELRTPLLAFPRADLESALENAERVTGTTVLSILDDLPTIQASHVGIILSPAEIRVLTHLRDGGRIEDAATALFVSPNTIKHQLKSAYRKLGVASRADALARAADLGLLD